MKNLNTCFKTLILLSSFIACSGHASSEIIAKEAWVREGPPSATVLAGYLVVQNNSKQAVTLASAHSPQFASTEMHESFEAQGMMRMKKHEQISIPPQGELAFTPNGFHLMLMDPTAPIRAGSNVTLVLKFIEIEQPITLDAPVKRVID